MTLHASLFQNTWHKHFCTDHWLASRIFATFEPFSPQLVTISRAYNTSHHHLLDISEYFLLWPLIFRFYDIAALVVSSIPFSALPEATCPRKHFFYLCLIYFIHYLPPRIYFISLHFKAFISLTCLIFRQALERPSRSSILISPTFSVIYFLFHCAGTLITLFLSSIWFLYSLTLVLSPLFSRTSFPYYLLYLIEQCRRSPVSYAFDQY